ncbi:hypothetical protein PM10SUCC1_02770 [Propionigenium maris DSM 9537]|uniref:Tail fiber protein n=1 Tax=Propionigenium maris DSM 9537 TaxID=1123000 RepID=A0A9W6GJF1_9FUSO|nr:hypothetical protein [Propionigenium maris]GLI54762.1 hypothetical protein PM10SUCC1_02770 [Propionigenium maris DSM 9537]
MAKYTGNTLTNLGKDLLARAVIGGEAFTFTKVELGKGVPGGDYEELTGLIEPFKVLAITSTAKLVGGSYRVRTAFSNSGIMEDTYLREIGVFARGEDGIEILYSYCYTDTPDLIPAEGGGVLERVEDVITYISNAANVNAVIDQSKVYATIKDLTEGLAEKEDKFDKNSGFNLDKTDSAETDSSILVATAKAVKKAWDKAKEAIGFTDTNKAAILNNTEQIDSLQPFCKILEFTRFEELGLNPPVTTKQIIDILPDKSRLVLAANIDAITDAPVNGGTLIIERLSNLRITVEYTGNHNGVVSNKFIGGCYNDIWYGWKQLDYL